MQHYLFKKLSAIEKSRKAPEVYDSEGVAMVSDLQMNTGDSFLEFTCPICQKLLQKCVTTLCGHSYCESCLDEYLIYKDTCFVCDFWGTKRVLLREKPLHVSFKVDDIINQIIDNCKNKAIKNDWLDRQT